MYHHSCIEAATLKVKGIKTTLSLTAEGCSRVTCPLPRPHAVEEAGVTIVPQPDLSGATEQMSADEVQMRLLKKAEELKGDSSLTEVRLGRQVALAWAVWGRGEVGTPGGPSLGSVGSR